jgi:hypothetical protein
LALGLYRIAGVLATLSQTTLVAGGIGMVNAGPAPVEERYLRWQATPL